MNPCTEEKSKVRWRCVNDILSYCSETGPKAVELPNEYGQIRRVCLRDSRTCESKKSLSEIMKEVRE